MDFKPRRERFRALLSGSECISPASVFDPMSARIAEDLGYDVGMFAGSIASYAVLGAPDMTLITLTEFAGQAYRICRAVEMPLLVDADHGYGNALNVKRTVEELENAGVAALTIEDTQLPAPFGNSGKPSLISLEEGVGKMKAALAGRQDRGLVIVGRTSAAGITGTEDAIARCKAYEAAGVDALFLAGMKEHAQVEAICAEVRLPVILGGTARGIGDRASLARLGVRITLQGHQSFTAAMAGVHRVLRALREGADPGDIEVPDKSFLEKLTRRAEYKQSSQEYLEQP